MIARNLLLLGTALGGAMMPGVALGQAFNGTPSTIAGFVSYDRGTPGVETIEVQSDSAIILWRPPLGDNPAEPDFLFLPAGNVATFTNGPNNANFAVLNRILVARPTRFNGTVLGRIIDLAGNSQTGGTVLFSSPGGIIIGSTAVFDVGNLVLTSLNVVDDGAGNFGGPAGNYVFDGGANRPDAAVVVEPGAQITALNQGSYVALVAPRVVQGGSVRANGSIAYVAGEALELRVNNGLFDIIVTAGSDNAVPILHTGTTGGPSSGAVDDIHRIYMVAVPKNQAITAILEGNVGFDDATVAGVENGTIVLSAGHSVVGGEVDRFANASPPPQPDAVANFHIRGGTISSDLTGVALTDMLASGQTTGNLTFEQDVRLFANRRAHLFAGSAETVIVEGNALISAARFDSADQNVTDLVGGEALLFALNGGSVTVNGDAVVTAAAQGRTNAAGMVGSGAGGTAGIFADQGNIQLNREVLVDSSGFGAAPPPGSPTGGAGTGGTAFVEGRNGGTVTINNSLDIFATGTASEANGLVPVTGATGQGGTIRIGTSGTGQVTVTGPAVISADGTGGAVLGGAGNVGGTGRGGDILVTQNGGSISLNGLSGFSASGFGGLGPAGGFGQGGTIIFDVTGAQFQFGGTATLAAGGTGGDSGLIGGDGGDGQGGSVRLTARNGGVGSRIGAGAIDIAATGTGGRGANFAAGTPAGDGGDGQGGDIVLLAEAGNGAIDFGALAAAADGQGGQGGGADNAVDGGDGGDGRGGTVTAGTAPGGAPSATGNARFASVDLRANGIGGAGGLGRGTGGDGFGGAAMLTAGGAPVVVTGASTLAANGNGGMGGVDPTGGGPGDDGQAAGGSVVLAATGANGTLNAGSVTGTASATGSATATNTPGQWHVNAGTGGAINLANLDLTAAAIGTVGTPAFSSIEPLGGTINVTGIANLITPGEIRVLASGAGRITGGRYNFGAGTDVTMSHAAPIAGGLTIDVADLFVVAGDDVIVNAGVVTRTSGQTDVRTADLASVAGSLTGNAILVRSGVLDVAATGAIGTAATATTDVQATGDANVAGQIQGQAIVLRSAALNVAATGAVGGPGTNTNDIAATGTATVAGQVGGITIQLNAAAINVAPTGTVGGAATNLAELRANGVIGVGGRVLGSNLLLASSDIDLPAGGVIGDAATQLVTLQPNATGQSVVLGGAAQGPGYTLTAAEAGRIRSATLQINAPAPPGGNPALIVRDVTFNGGGAANGIGMLELFSPGITRVEGALAMVNAAAGNGMTINSTERLEVITPAGIVRVRNAAGAPGGILQMQSDNLWIASQAIIDQLRIDPNYAARDADLLDNDGIDAPRGYIEADTVTLGTGGTMFVQNTTGATGTFVTGNAFGGITVGPGGLTVQSGGRPGTVTAFGRRLNADGSFTTGDDFFFSVDFSADGAPLAAGFTPASALNTCIIVTGQCPLRPPPATGPGGPDPTTGPLGGSDSILLPPGAEADDLVDTSFAAEGLIEEPVTSGGDNNAWDTDCDRDNDGDCDEIGQ